MGEARPAIADVAAHHLRQANAAARWGTCFILIITGGLIVVFGRVVQLKLAPDPRIAEVSGSVHSSRSELARRGDLLDRRGRVLASSTFGQLLFIDPVLVDDPATIAVDIAQLINLDPIDIDRKLASAPVSSRYVRVVDLLEDWQIETIRNANLRGVGFQPRPVRHSLHGALAAALLGRVGFEHSGLSGMEHRFEQTLEPEAGQLVFLRDVRRRPLWIPPDGYQPGDNGSDVRLSIDLVIQEIAERRLDAAVTQMNAGGGRIIVLDPRSGEILAIDDILRSRPGWDEQTDDPLRAKDPSLGRNRCVTDPYEPGSTFKPFVWALATELGHASPDDVLPTPASTGWRTPYGRLIRDTFYYEDSPWRRVLVKSQNTGMAMVAERMSHRDMQSVLTRFGYGEETRCGLPGESAGIITPPGKWTRYSQTSLSFGHEISVTAVQMVRAFSAFARDGTIPSLRLTAVTDDDQDFRVIRRAIQESTALTTREVMRSVMTEGSGRHAQSELYQLFGKSGTAQLPKKRGGGYHEDRYVSSFIAGAPYTNPRIVVLCIIDDPDRTKGHFGGAIAGPVVRDVIDEVLQYLGVTPDAVKDLVQESPALLEVARAQ